MLDTQRPRIGVALGGGAARGLAHVGVLRALHREGIPVHIVTGTSMGAIIGGSFAAGVPIDELERGVRQVLTSEEFRRNRISFLKESKQQRGGLVYSVKNLIRRGIFFGVSNMRPSFLAAEEFAGSMEAVLPECDIPGMPLTFAAVTLDIETAEEVMLCTGSLRSAAAASSAIPGILPPVPLHGRKLIDGGWVDKIPVLPAHKLGADVVIGVDITADLENGASYERGVDIMVRANAIKDDALVGFSRRLADVLITPEVGHVHWADFGAFEACIEEGERAVMDRLPEIKHLIAKERLMSRLRPTRRKRQARFHLKALSGKLIVL